MACTEVQPSLPTVAISMMLPFAKTATIETTPLSGKNTWSSGLSASIRTSPRWQRTCSSSSINRARSAAGRASKSRLRGQSDGAFTRSEWRRSSARPLTAAPTAGPAAAPSAATVHQPDDQQQYDCANGGVDNRCDHSSTKMDSKPRQQPVAKEGADNSDDDVADHPKTRTPDELTGKPPRNQPDEQYDEETFIRRVHGGALGTADSASRTALVGLTTNCRALPPI